MELDMIHFLESSIRTLHLVYIFEDRFITHTSVLTISQIHTTCGLVFYLETDGIGLIHIASFKLDDTTSIKRNVVFTTTLSLRFCCKVIYLRKPMACSLYPA